MSLWKQAISLIFVIFMAFSINITLYAAQTAPFPYSQFNVPNPLELDLQKANSLHQRACDILQSINHGANSPLPNSCKFVEAYHEMNAIGEWLTNQALLSHNPQNLLSLPDIYLSKNWDDFYLQSIMWSYSINFPSHDYIQAKSIIEKIIKWGFLRKKLSTLLWIDTAKPAHILLTVENPKRNLGLALLRTQLETDSLFKQTWLISESYLICGEDPTCKSNTQEFLYQSCQIAKKYQPRAKTIYDAFSIKSPLAPSNALEIFTAINLKTQTELLIMQAILDEFANGTVFALPDSDLISEIINVASVETSDNEFYQETKKTYYISEILRISKLCDRLQQEGNLIPTHITLNSDSKNYFLAVETEAKETLSYFEKKYNHLIEEMH